VRISLYRPFFAQNLYFSRDLNNCVYQMPQLFPTADTKNLLICVSCVGTNKDLSLFISNKIVDLHFVGDTQCFPLYYYTPRSETEGTQIPFDFGESDGDEQYIRHDGITDWMLQRTRQQYNAPSIAKEDIFYYVYGILHAPAYRETFAVDLKKSLPRLPLVDSYDDFLQCSRIGRQLAQLHLNYEHQPAPEGIEEVHLREQRPDESPYDYYAVKKLRWGRDRSSIVYNEHIRVDHIPQDVGEYVVNGRNPLEWLLDRYKDATDNASLIRNNANDWAREHRQPRYIIDLLLSLCALAQQTQTLVSKLPQLEFN